MKLQEFTFIILQGHGIVRNSKGSAYMAELVDLYLLGSRDLLMSKMFKDIAQNHGVEKKDILLSLRNLAQTIKRNDPEWYACVFNHGFNSCTFVRTISREVLASYCAHFET